MLQIQDGTGRHFVEKRQFISQEWLDIFQPSLTCRQKTPFQTILEAHITNSGEIKCGNAAVLNFLLKAASPKWRELSQAFASKLN